MQKVCGKQRRLGALFVFAGVCAGLYVSPARAIPFLSPTVTIEFDQSANLARRTYSWGDAQMAVPTYNGVLKSIIDADLQKRGWTAVASGGEATIFALGQIHSGADLETYYHAHPGAWAQEWGTQGWGAGWKPLYGEATYNALNTAGTHLVIDIQESGSHKLLYRAVTAVDLSNTEKQNTKALTSSLKQIFKKFPPKAKSQ